MARPQRTTTLDRRAAQALIDQLWEEKRRVMQTHSAVRFHEGGYQQGSEPNVALAEFRAHTDSPTYAYPLPSDENEDYVFPAFIQRLPSFTDDTTDGGFTEDQDIAWPGSYDFDQEPVIVYSLRRNYIPPNTVDGDTEHRLLPIVQINDKWYCDYTPRLRLTFTASSSSGDIGPGAVAIYNQVNSAGSNGRIYEGVTSETYSPLRVSDTGIITAHRKMDCLVTLTMDILCYANAVTGTVFASGTVTKKTSTTTADLTNMPALNFFIAPTSTYSFGGPSAHTATAVGLVRFEMGDTLQFELTSTSNQADINGDDLVVTLTPIETNSW